MRPHAKVPAEREGGVVWERHETERGQKRASEQSRERASERKGEQETAMDKERERKQGLIEEG